MREDDVVLLILEKGRTETTDSIRTNTWASKNNSRGTNLDFRGSASTTSGVGGGR